MSYHIRVVPASASVGAEIGGVDLAKPLRDDMLGDIDDAFRAMAAGEVARTVLTFD